jgi:anhydro-N-acetylmuramic acid kinase
MSDYFIGLMSGTSVDGIDAVIVDFSGTDTVLVKALTSSWPVSLRDRILLTLTNPGQTSIPELGALDAEIGHTFAAAALDIINAAGLTPDRIKAIGSHGQTLFHSPDSSPAFSIQAGDAHRIAELTGITTVADFRRRDIAAGGQGAPLVPAFHQARFACDHTHRAILNIGGMANLTCLPAGRSGAVIGFDTGPGNVLMDLWIQQHLGQDCDRNGDWARSGKPVGELLNRMLNEPYFSRTPPKSTGRELFNRTWLERMLGSNSLPEIHASDIQASLCELSARSIVDAIRAFAPYTEELFVCGGGVHNGLVMQRLVELLPDLKVASTETLGLHPDWVEATAFAWLARQALAGLPGNLPEVTGARYPVILGAIHPGRASAGQSARTPSPTHPSTPV